MKEKTEAQRLQFVPAITALLIGFFMFALTLFRYIYPAFELFNKQSSSRIIVLRQIIHFGVIPLVIFSLILLIYKPSSFLISQRKNTFLTVISAFLLGIISAFSYYVVIELFNRLNWIDQVNTYLPKSLTILQSFLPASGIKIISTLVFSVLLPTVTLIPLFLGLFLSPLLGSGRKFLSITFTCLLGALMPLDSTGIYAYLLLWILLSRIYTAGSGLIATAFSCCGYLVTLMYSPLIFAQLNNQFIAWQSSSELQGTLLVFALLLIVLILGLPGIFYFNILDRNQRRKHLSLSLQPHISKHLEKTENRSAASWVLIAIGLILLLAALVLNHFIY